MFYPQSNFYPQGIFGAQGGFNPQASLGPQGIQSYPGIIPFANTLLAHQLAAQQFATQHPSGLNGFSGLSNGVAQPTGAWPQQQLNPQQQINPEQFNPGLVQPQRHYQVLQQLAQFHYLVAQQLAQLAAQQVIQSAGNPYTGQFIPSQQFIPGQLGANYVPGGTMH